MTTGGTWQPQDGPYDANPANGASVPPPAPQQPPAPPAPEWHTLPAEPAPYGQQQFGQQQATPAYPPPPGYPTQPAAPQPYAQQSYGDQYGYSQPAYGQQQPAPQYGAAPGIENYSAGVPTPPVPAAYSYGYSNQPMYGGNPTAKNWMGIVGLVCFFFGLGLVSVILGHLGRAAAKRGEATNAGVALVAVVLGYLQVIGVTLGIVSSVVIPVIVATRDVTAQDDWIVVDDTLPTWDDPADEVVGDIAGATRVDAASLAPGMCFLDPSSTATFDDNNNLVYTDYMVVDCSQPHFGEVYVQTESTLASFDPDALHIDAEDQCIDHGFAEYVGLDYMSSIYEVSYYAPTEESWNWGDRGITCAIVDYDSALVGSVAGSAQ